MRTVAVLCFENPFNKPSDGAKNDMLTRVKALCGLKDCLIDIYAFNKPNEEEVCFKLGDFGISNLFQYRIQNVGWKGIFGKYPISVYRRFTEDCCEELKRHKYDVIIYEGEHMSSYRICKIGSADIHVLRQHDIESKYRYELSKSAHSLVEKVGQIFESVKYHMLERKIDTYFDEILFISKEECMYFLEKFQDSNCKFTFMPPATMSFAEKVISETSNNTMLYFGNMTLQNNFLSILWFVQEVLPLICKAIPEVKLKIIGKMGADDAIKIENSSTNIELLGYVDDLRTEIENASLIVSPVLFGAGVKVKIIDALSYGQIVCATRKAVEGTDLEDGVHLIVEDNPKNLAAKCVDIMRNREKYLGMAESGLKFVKRYHSVEYQSEILNNVWR